MTILVWDGKTLAADKQISYNGVACATTKIFRVDDLLVGFAGDASRAMAVLQWIKNGLPPESYPNVIDHEDGLVLTTLIVLKDGRVALLERTPYPIDLTANKWHCTGAGADLAYGALEMGADARKAVEVACKYSQYCGHGVDTLTWGPSA